MAENTNTGASTSPGTLEHPSPTDSADSNRRELSAAAPHGDGWVDRLLDLPDRLPGPSLIWFAALFIAVLVTGGIPARLAAETTAEIEIYVLLPAAIFVYFLAFSHILRRVARSSFDEFKPALRSDEAEHDLLRWELARVPDLQALAAAAVIVLVVGAAAANSGSDSGLPPVANLVAWVMWIMAMATLAIAVLYVARQLTWVRRLYAMARNVDPFDTGPVNGLSRVAAAGGIGILVVSLVFIFGSGESLGTEEFTQWFPILIGLGLVALAVTSFVAPLRGMHSRLVAEKARMLTASTARMKTALSLIHQTVDTGEFARADELQKTLTSLLAERDVLTKLPTWPWSPGTLRGFATAAVLPIVLWLVFRLLERLV